MLYPQRLSLIRAQKWLQPSNFPEQKFKIVIVKFHQSPTFSMVCLSLLYEISNNGDSSDLASVPGKPSPEQLLGHSSQCSERGSQPREEFTLWM